MVRSEIPRAAELSPLSVMFEMVSFGTDYPGIWIQTYLVENPETGDSAPSQSAAARDSTPYRSTFIRHQFEGRHLGRPQVSPGPVMLISTYVQHQPPRPLGHRHPVAQLARAAVAAGSVGRAGAQSLLSPSGRTRLRTV
ncbi:hypothetical protein RHA1_ro08905 (plasmid) [Rhodococcus jostii RHA1]|uniref:Uncharacterized protein n=1 Tax=Rhodococcus jostii (strain RHA1) TaxID=101510 RepID=Q0RXN7_RHOJR|nr:hypothetical protein RHA1_ro08905 [Rhodococcus jostii RHA1]